MKNIAINIIVATVLLLFSSCHVNHGKPCIEIEKMSDILAEAYVAPHTFTDIRMNKGDKREYYFSNIFERYHVSEAEFDSALTWYTANPEENKKLYDRVIDKLNIKINQIENGQ